MLIGLLFYLICLRKTHSIAYSLFLICLQQTQHSFAYLSVICVRKHIVLPILYFWFACKKHNAYLHTYLCLIAYRKNILKTVMPTYWKRKTKHAASQMAWKKALEHIPLPLPRPYLSILFARAVVDDDEGVNDETPATTRCGTRGT